MVRRRLDATEYTVGWICALPLELSAAQVMLDEEHLLPDGISSAQYTLGRIGDHNVVLACLQAGRMGIGPAASSAGQLMANFPSARLGLMVGIGGGVPSTADVRLGDVIVSQPFLQHGGVVQYDFGKTMEEGRLSQIGSLNAPPKDLLYAVSRMRARRYQDREVGDSLAMLLSAFDKHPHFSYDNTGPDVLYEATYQHSGGATCERCSKESIVQRKPRTDSEKVAIHYGTIASGNQVIKDAVTRDRLSNELGGILCFEMEAAGLMNDFSSLVVRGICDYADTHKSKAWQPYAAATAAACAKIILSFVPATMTLKTNKACDYRIPFSMKGVPVGKFAQRPRDTDALDQALLLHNDVKQQRLLVLSGLGGMADNSETSLKQSFAAFAGRIPEGQISDSSRLYAATQKGELDLVVKDVLGWLSLPDNSNWLLVFDNIDLDDRRQDEDVETYNVENYLPGADHGSVLITTRLHHLGQLEKLGQESDELLGLLDGLPLALSQAAAYMGEVGTDFETYARLYKKQWQELMESNSERGPLRSYANGSVATTWSLSYTAIRRTNEAAADLLLLWAQLDDKDLGHGLLAVALRSRC